MKKTLMAGLVGLLATTTFAGMNNLVVTFGTVGPDKYADGTTVVDGESYALVWTPAGSEFAGFNADGSAVAPSQVALKAALAKNGKCPTVCFQLTEEEKAAYNGGTWAVYMLDTRVFTTAADGTVSATGADASVTHGYGKAAALNGDFAVASASSAATANALAADKSDAKITGIKVADGKVFITISGTSSAASYALNAGDAPDKTAEAEVKQGDTTGDVIIVRDAKAGGEFFSVNRK